MDKNPCPYRIYVRQRSYCTVTTLIRLLDVHFGKAASIGRQMTENTVQNDGALWGTLSHSVPSAILMFKLLDKQ